MAFILLVVFAGLFVLSHVGLSSLPLKRALVKGLGEKGFMGLYALVSFLTFGGAIVVYAFFGARGPLLFAPLGWSDAAIYILMSLSILFIVLSTATPSPVGADMGKASKPEARGILRVTAHPQNWGMICFGLAHVLATGTAGGLALYGSFVALGLIGACHETAKKAKDKDEAVQAFLAETGVVPFSAILRGKNKLVLSEFKPLSLLVVLLVFGVTTGLHFLL
jgi:uncharacterized membrane protein